MSTNQGRIWPISLHQIEASVSAHLGPGRVPGNHQDSAFSRQVSMYLAKHVGRWSTTKIGKFYNGRHHTTVLYSIEKIESLRKKDARLDALLELLCAELSVWSTHARFGSVPRLEGDVHTLVSQAWAPRSGMDYGDDRLPVGSVSVSGTDT